MKKFSSLKKEVKPKYELKESLRNEIYSLIEKSLSIKISNDESIDKDINLIGKEELVEKVKNLIDDIRIKERTLTLETVKANVHRNFDMKWLNEQIDTLKKSKISSDLILTENILDTQVQEIPGMVQVQETPQELQEIPQGNDELAEKTKTLEYFVKQLNEDKKIGNFEFEYEPADGIFKFVNENDGVIVKATPFYNDNNGLPIEVFDEEQSDSHIFIEQRDFHVKGALFEKYLEIMNKFLVEDFDEWMNKVDKFDDENEK